MCTCEGGRAEGGRGPPADSDTGLGVMTLRSRPRGDIPLTEPRRRPSSPLSGPLVPGLLHTSWQDRAHPREPPPHPCPFLLVPLSRADPLKPELGTTGLGIVRRLRAMSPALIFQGPTSTRSASGWARGHLPGAQAACWGWLCRMAGSEGWAPCLSLGGCWTSLEGAGSTCRQHSGPVLALPQTWGLGAAHGGGVDGTGGSQTLFLGHWAAWCLRRAPLLSVLICWVWFDESLLLLKKIT